MGIALTGITALWVIGVTALHQSCSMGKVLGEVASQTSLSLGQVLSRKPFQHTVGIGFLE